MLEFVDLIRSDPAPPPPCDRRSTKTAIGTEREERRIEILAYAILESNLKAW